MSIEDDVQKAVGPRQYWGAILLAGLFSGGLTSGGLQLFGDTNSVSRAEVKAMIERIERNENHANDERKADVAHEGRIAQIETSVDHVQKTVEKIEDSTERNSEKLASMKSSVESMEKRMDRMQAGIDAILQKVR